MSRFSIWIYRSSRVSPVCALHKSAVSKCVVCCGTQCHCHDEPPNPGLEGAISEHRCRILDEITVVWGGGGVKGSFVGHRYFTLRTFAPPHFGRAYGENDRTISFFVLRRHVICDAVSVIRSYKNGDTEENASSTYNFGSPKSDAYLKKSVFKI